MLGAGRTSSMLYMDVTLDVSRLNGWLNADADCRVWKAGDTRRGEEAGLCEVAAEQAACRGSTGG